MTTPKSTRKQNTTLPIVQHWRTQKGAQGSTRQPHAHIPCNCCEISPQAHCLGKCCWRLVI